jgi:hypothetical protein
MMNEQQQAEMDVFEEAILADIFGGTTKERMVFKAGIFKIDVSARVQKAINRMEEAFIPFLTEDGFFNMENLKKYIDLKCCEFPSEQYRPIELYRKIQPFAKTIIKEILS